MTVRRCKTAKSCKYRRLLQKMQKVVKDTKGNRCHRLFAKQLFTDFYNIASTHCDQKVSCFAIIQQEIFDFIKSREILTWSTQFLDSCL